MESFYKNKNQWLQINETETYDLKDEQQNLSKIMRPLSQYNRRKNFRAFIYAVVAFFALVLILLASRSRGDSKSETSDVAVVNEDRNKVFSTKVQNIQKLEELIKIPERIKEQLNENQIKKYEKVYLSYRFLLNSEKDAELQKQYNEQQYKIRQFQTEILICVLIFAENYSSEQLIKLLKSIDFQVYENYKIFIYNYNYNQNGKKEQLSKKVKFIDNLKSIDWEKGNIVIPVKNKGELIGKTLFKKLNSLYQAEEIEGTYSSLLRYSFEMKRPFASVENKEGLAKQLRARLIFQEGFVTFRFKQANQYDYIYSLERICSNISLYNSLLKWKIPKFYLIEEFDFYISSQSKDIEKCISQRFLENEKNSNRLQFFTGTVPGLGKQDEIIDKLKQIPVKSNLEPWHNKHDQSEHALYSYRIAVALENLDIQRAAYKLYDLKYNLSKYSQELPICIISSGRNLMKHNVYKKYVKSLGYLNYTNFKAVYVDDASDDGTVENLRNYMENEFLHLSKYLTIVENKQRIRSTGTRFIAIREHCSEDDIIIDYDADDQLAGVNILKLFSALYQQNTDKWLIYSKSVQNNHHRLYQGNSHAVNAELFKDNSMRLYPFVINHLRSFPRRIFMKLNPADFQDSNGTYFPYVGDYYIYCAIAELSGAERILFVDEPSVYYKTEFTAENVEQKQYWARKAINQPPYLPLSSLDSRPVHGEIRIYFVKKQQIIENSLKFYSDLNKVSLSKNKYLPAFENKENQEQIREILNLTAMKKKVVETAAVETAAVETVETTATTTPTLPTTTTTTLPTTTTPIIIASNKNLQKMAALSYELYVNRTKEMYSLEKYYYDTRYNIDIYRNNEISIYLVVKAISDLAQTEAFFDSINLQEYKEFTVLFLYELDIEKRNTFEMLFKNYPWLIETTEFIKIDKFKSYQQIIKQFCSWPAIFIKTSLHNQLVGTRTLKYLNSVFQSNPRTQVAVSFSLLSHRGNVLEVAENGEQYYRKSHSQNKDEKQGMIAYYFKNNETALVKSSQIFFIKEMLSVVQMKSGIKVIEEDKQKQEKIEKLKVMKKEWEKMKKNEEIKQMLLYEPNSELAMAYEISADPDNAIYNELQLYDFSRKYGILTNSRQQKLCVVAFGKNLMKNDQYKKFVSSIVRQKYANYAVVYIDLDSYDGTANVISSEFAKIGEKIRKIHFDKQSSEEKLTKLKSMIIGQNCKEDELVVEIPSNGELIGQNVFSLINLNAQKNPYNWFTVFNSIVISDQKPYRTSTLKAQKNWDIFNMEKVMVYKKFLRVAVANQGNINDEGSVYEVMSQFCGARMQFQSEYVYLVRDLGFFVPLSQEQKIKHYKILINPFTPLRSQKDVIALREQQNPLSEYLPFEEQRSTVFLTKLISTQKIQAAEQAQKVNEQQKLLFEATTPFGKNSEKKKNDIVYMYYHLKQEPNNPKWLAAEHYHINKEYGIDKISEQLPICVISAGRNLKSKGELYTEYIDSFARLNYSNFKIFYEDDQSDDGTAEAMREYTMKNYPQLNKKFNIIQNTNRLYSLANKNNMVRNHCSNQDEIVYDIDADDFLMGRQFFKVLNSIYRQDYWVVWANYCVVSYGCILKGVSHEISPAFLKEHTYRRRSFATVGPRSFRRRLFLKIDEKQFKDENGSFFKESSDAFIYNSLVELAGPNRIKFLPETPYFYNQYNLYGDLELKKSMTLISRTQVPFDEMSSLSEPARKVKNYKIDEYGEKQIEKTIVWLDQLIKERDRKSKAEKLKKKEK